MARKRQEEDEWDDEEDEFSADDDWSDTVPCPYCREPIHEDAQRCPYCEHYISEEDSPRPLRPWWFVVGFLLCMLVALMWALGR